MLLHVMDRDGIQHELTAHPPTSLMEVLRDVEYGVLATCGGSCACATCHVYVAPLWLEQLPPQHSDERELVSGLEHRHSTSRLSCQIQLAPALDGLCVTLAPEE
jgi:2Fe-2S ferredoxin